MTSKKPILFLDNKQQLLAAGLLSILYLVGLAGVLLPVHPEFMLLTPINLLVSLALVLWFHPRWSRQTYLVLAMSYVVGFGAEVFGVATGLLFGNYTYGPVLGPQVWETPLMIGVNWMMLVYICGVTANHILDKRAWYWRGLLGAVLMVGLDFFIEPVAMRTDMWTWAGNHIPVQNFVGWFAVALPLHLLFAKLQGAIRNKPAMVLLVWQFLFFIVLNIFLT